MLARCGWALALDTASGRWWLTGADEARQSSAARAALALLQQIAIATRPTPRGPDTEAPNRNLRAADTTPAFALGPLQSATGQALFERGVLDVRGHLHAGEIFQANLTHRLTGRFVGCARALMVELLRRASPWHGVYLEWDQPACNPADVDARRAAPMFTRRAICSASPELFLSIEPDRRGVSGAGGTMVRTRPMKGTRRRAEPGGARAASDAVAAIHAPAAAPADASLADLWASEKDRAELAMIVDLMRNDLGRVAQTGTVCVESLRTAEAHGSGLWQTTATVSALVGSSLSRLDLLRATLPPGSVTGAPKISAVRILRTLEPVVRGPYCGTLGWFSDSGDALLNVAIRTACISGHGEGRTEPGAGESARRPGVQGSGAAPAGGLFGEGFLDYHVGGGIVADSQPQAEWLETLDKAGTILTLSHPPTPSHAEPDSTPHTRPIIGPINQRDVSFTRGRV